MIWTVILPVLATVKVIIQGWVSRKKCATLGDSLLLNSLIFGAATIVLFPIKFSGFPSVKIMLPALMFGIFSMAFQCFYILAFKSGPVGMTTVMNNFNLLFPILCGALLYHEAITAYRVIGMLAMAVSLILLPNATQGKINRKWLFFSLLALVSAGMNNVLLMLVSHAGYSRYESDMIVVTGMAVASILSLIISFFFRKSLHRSLSFANVGGILICGFALGMYNCLTVVALRVVPSVVLYPIVNVLTIMIITLSDYVIYKEKLSKKQIVGLVTAAVAVVLMS